MEFYSIHLIQFHFILSNFIFCFLTLLFVSSFFCPEVLQLQVLFTAILGAQTVSSRIVNN